MRRIWTHGNLRNESLITKLSEHKGMRENEEGKRWLRMLECQLRSVGKHNLKINQIKVNNASKLELHGSATFKNFSHTN